MKNRVLITGVSAIHGWPIYQRLSKILPQENIVATKPPKTKVSDGFEFVSTCITDQKLFESIRKNFKPTHIFHCAGVCDLDVCEARPDWAYQINVTGSKTIAQVFGDVSHVTYISTDLVFSGLNTPKGGYTEKCEPDPISVAGKTFLEAEKYIQQCPKHCIVRVALPIGDSINGKIGAVNWIESRFKRNLPVTLFYDEYRSCADCDQIGELSEFILNCNLQGLYHFGGEKRWSLYELGEHVLKKGNYPAHLYDGINRHEDKNNLPRIGDVSFNSSKILSLLNEA